MSSTYLITNKPEPAKGSIESILLGSNDVVSLAPRGLAGVRASASDVFLVSDDCASDPKLADLPSYGLVQFLGCRPPGVLLELSQSTGVTVAGISPVIAGRVSNRVIGFTGPLNVVSRGYWGVVGLGTIGTEVATKVTANRSTVSVADIRTPRSGVLRDLEARRNTLDLLVAGSDVITLHVHHGATADPLISERELHLMKPQAVLINTSSPYVVDERAVLDSLRRGDLAGYATDCPGSDIEVAYEDPALQGKLIVTTNPLTNQIGAPQQIAKFVEQNVSNFRDGSQLSGVYEPVDFPTIGDPSFWSSRMSPRQD